MTKKLDEGMVYKNHVVLSGVVKKCWRGRTQNKGIERIAFKIAPDPKRDFMEVLCLLWGEDCALFDGVMEGTVVEVSGRIDVWRKKDKVSGTWTDETQVKCDTVNILGLKDYMETPDDGGDDAPPF